MHLVFWQPLIIRFPCSHLSALQEAVEEIGALDRSQILRDVERLDVYLDHDKFKEEVQALEVWRKDMLAISVVVWIACRRPTNPQKGD
jgi:hypothetical protein